MCVSGDIYADCEEVIHRPRFGRTENEIADTLRAIRETGLWVKPSPKVRTCTDSDEDVFLERAPEASPSDLVTALKGFSSKSLRGERPQCQHIERSPSR
jgi:predicted nucleic acid-binding protein